jgi:hypothetical protein
MFNPKIEFHNNEVVKNVKTNKIESNTPLKDLNDINLAGGFSKEHLNNHCNYVNKGQNALNEATRSQVVDKELLRTEPPNSDPNQAYQISMDVLYTDSITGQGQRRWYVFQTTTQKKITAYMSPANDLTVDNDLSLYRLDTSTGYLTVVAESQNPAAVYELLSYVADPGYYFLCVAAYAGTTENEYSFLVRLSDTWDSNEPDDSLLQASAQPLFSPVKHTIDNSIDQDVTILNISEAGNYSISLYNVPDNVNYQLQVLNTNMQVIDTVNKNSSKCKNLQIGSYVLRLMSTDGTFNNNEECSVLVSLIPNVIDVTSSDHYECTVTSNHKHVIEVMSIQGLHLGNNSGAVIGVSVDGTPISVNGIYLTITRYNSSTNGSECSVLTSNDTLITGVGICSSYFGSNQSSAIGLSTPIMLNLSVATYAESHYQVTSSGRQTWANAISVTDSMTEIIFDIDNMSPADLYLPNWYFGDPSICGYPAYGSIETPGISFSKTYGKCLVRS